MPEDNIIKMVEKTTHMYVCPNINKINVFTWYIDIYKDKKNHHIYIYPIPPQTNYQLLCPGCILYRLDFEPFERVRFSDPSHNNGWITGSQRLSVTSHLLSMQINLGRQSVTHENEE